MDINASTLAAGDLTSTMESVLTSDDHEKTNNENESVPVCDSVPSSSSDANLQATTADTTQDDPISSTSDTMKDTERNLNNISDIDTEHINETNELVTDSYFFSTDLNMASISTEKISEDVEDIANDLENLLGEANNDYISSNSEKSFRISNERLDMLLKIDSKETSLSDVTCETKIISTTNVAELQSTSAKLQDVIDEQSTPVVIKDCEQKSLETSKPQLDSEETNTVSQTLQGLPERIISHENQSVEDVLTDKSQSLTVTHLTDVSNSPILHISQKIGELAKDSDSVLNTIKEEGESENVAKVRNCSNVPDTLESTVSEETIKENPLQSETVHDLKNDDLDILNDDDVQTNLQMEDVEEKKVVVETTIEFCKNSNDNILKQVGESTDVIQRNINSELKNDDISTHSEQTKDALETKANDILTANEPPANNQEVTTTEILQDLNEEPRITTGEVQSNQCETTEHNKNLPETVINVQCDEDNSKQFQSTEGSQVVEDTPTNAEKSDYEKSTFKEREEKEFLDGNQTTDYIHSEEVIEDGESTKEPVVQEVDNLEENNTLHPQSNIDEIKNVDLRLGIKDCKLTEKMTIEQISDLQESNIQLQSNKELDEQETIEDTETTEESVVQQIGNLQENSTLHLQSNVEKNDDFIEIIKNSETSNETVQQISNLEEDNTVHQQSTVEEIKHADLKKEIIKDSETADKIVVQQITDLQDSNTLHPQSNVDDIKNDDLKQEIIKDGETSGEIVQEIRNIEENNTLHQQPNVEDLKHVDSKQEIIEDNETTKETVVHQISDLEDIYLQSNVEQIKNVDLEQEKIKGSETSEKTDLQQTSNLQENYTLHPQLKAEESKNVDAKQTGTKLNEKEPLASDISQVVTLEDVDIGTSLETISSIVSEMQETLMNDKTKVNLSPTELNKSEKTDEIESVSNVGLVGSIEENTRKRKLDEDVSAALDVESPSKKLKPETKLQEVIEIPYSDVPDNQMKIQADETSRSEKLEDKYEQKPEVIVEKVDSSNTIESEIADHVTDVNLENEPSQSMESIKQVEDNSEKHLPDLTETKNVEMKVCPINTVDVNSDNEQKIDCLKETDNVQMKAEENESNNQQITDCIKQTDVEMKDDECKSHTEFYKQLDAIHTVNASNDELGKYVVDESTENIEDVQNAKSNTEINQVLVTSQSENLDGHLESFGDFLDTKVESGNVLNELIESNIEQVEEVESNEISTQYKSSELSIENAPIELLEGVSITENDISEQIDLLIEKQDELQESSIEITQIQEEFDQNIDMSETVEEQIPLIDSTATQDLYETERENKSAVTIEEIPASEFEQSDIEESKQTCIIVEPEDEEKVTVNVSVVDEKIRGKRQQNIHKIESTKISEEKIRKRNLEIEDTSYQDKNVTSFKQAKDFMNKDPIETPLVIQIGEPNKVIQETQGVSKYSSKMSANKDLKMTITKHKGACKDDGRNRSESTHSILKICDSAEKVQQSKENTVPKLIIKPVMRTPILSKNEESEQTVPKITIKPIMDLLDSQHSPKLIIKNLSPNSPSSPKVSKVQKSEMLSPLKLTIKPVDVQQKISPKTRSTKQDEDNVKITIKPIIRPTQDEELSHNPKITIKPILRPEECVETCPRITIKPILKPQDDKQNLENETELHSPRITIKPIVKPVDESVEATHSPRITIKPIVKDDSKEQEDEVLRSPRITIKPIVKPNDDVKQEEITHSPRITIKPIVKLHEDSRQESVGSPKITIKPIKHPENENDPVDLIDFEDQIKQERIVLKINKSSMGKESRKREASEETEKLGKIKLKFSKEGGRAHIVSDQGKLKRALEGTLDVDSKRTRFETGDLTITPIEVGGDKKQGTEKSSSVASNSVDISLVGQGSLDDPLEKIPIFEITPESAAVMKNVVPAVPAQPVAPAPRKRGRPRKVPLVVREEFKDTKEEEAPPPPPITEDTGRPKRSCRGPSVRTTLGIRTRRPRGSGRGRGRGRGSRGGGSRGGRQQRVSAAKLKLLKEEAAAAIAEHTIKLEEIEIKEEQTEDVSTRTSDIVLIEEETRMSADINNSRAQTPAKQVPTPGDVEDTQSSVQSTATTESVKVRKGTRMEIHQEPEGEVISADQLAEYYWGGGGPFMLQEQVAQFLGIKSFKRKYPGIHRRTVEMQERDFIRESGLASEAMCDLGLTSVNSADILDIMYSDFQHKYEEYCKHQRDRQAKDFTNKQKALSLAASQEKNKLDITQQAVQSAASWNINFNKARKDERKACMDLQTFTVHYPKGKFRNIDKPKVGHYPVALVPGQFTDYYKTFTPTELNNLPLNTMLYNPINLHNIDDSHSDGSESDSDSSSSDSDSSSSDSSDEDCNVCSPASSTTKKVIAN